MIHSLSVTLTNVYPAVPVWKYSIRFSIRVYHCVRPVFTLNRVMCFCTSRSACICCNLSLFTWSFLFLVRSAHFMFHHRSITWPGLNSSGGSPAVVTVSKWSNASLESWQSLVRVLTQLFHLMPARKKEVPLVDIDPFSSNWCTKEMPPNSLITQCRDGCVITHI